MKNQLSHLLQSYQEIEARAKSKFGKPAQRAGIGLLLAVVVLIILTGTAWAESPNIEGTYNLYVIDGLSGAVWTTMTIYDQKDGTFSVKGDGWTGQGTLNWMSGSYHWKLANGLAGRTTFAIQANGIINGQVHGMGPEFNWDYIAKPQGNGAVVSCQECDSKRAHELPACNHKPTPGEQVACTNQVNTQWAKCLDRCVR